MRPQMEALTKVGLLSATKVQKSESTLSRTSQPATYTRYSVVPSGEQAVHAGTDKFLDGTDICFAHRTITKIETSTEPADAMGVKFSQVTYDYTLTDIASWTKDAAVQSAFPGIMGTLAKADGRQREALDQTNTG